MLTCTVHGRSLDGNPRCALQASARAKLFAGPIDDCCRVVMLAQQDDHGHVALATGELDPALADRLELATLELAGAARHP